MHILSFAMKSDKEELTARRDEVEGKFRQLLQLADNECDELLKSLIAIVESLVEQIRYSISPHISEQTLNTDKDDTSLATSIVQQLARIDEALKIMVSLNWNVNQMQSAILEFKDQAVRAEYSSPTGPKEVSDNAIHNIPLAK